MFEIETRVETLKGSHKGDIGEINKVIPVPGMETEYTVGFDTNPYEMVIFESNLRNVHDDLFEDVMFGNHAGHGYTGTEIHYEIAQIGWYHPEKRNEPDSEESKSIWVYGEGDRPAPHFHFYRGKDRKRGGCIQLETNEYFPHDGHDDTLDKQEVKQLAAFLRSTDSDTQLSVWKLTRLAWNQQNPRFRVNVNKEMPPYLQGISLPE